jgi:hypothetical protein|nr:MAG TPA: hypothetical protein [Caudoviricetes sp.]
MNLEIRVIRNTAKKFISDIQKESLKASRRAINKCGLNLRNEVRKNLRSSGIHITDARKNKNGKLYNDKLLQGVRAGKTFRKDDKGFARYVRITKNKRNKRSGWFRLGWLDKGTKQRTTKKHSTGSMIGAHFYDSALASYQSKFGQEYNNEMNKALTKLK